jgi:lipoate-protein ligase B
LTGVWVGQEKLAAIGVRIARWITSPRVRAATSAPTSDYFNLIIPCGIPDRGVTSLERLLGRAIDSREVEDSPGWPPQQHLLVTTTVTNIYRY